MIRKILVFVVALIAAFLFYVNSRPSSFRVERSIAINSSPEAVFAIISDLHEGINWSPWEELDPNMKKVFSGPEKGVGSKLAWDGNDDVGAGSQEIITAESPSKLVTKLVFLRPFEATNHAEFSIKQEGSGSEITWAMYGENNFGSKLFGCFVNMDEMIGKDFEKGLSKLKKYSEK